jgi:plasmid stabilization system protein ParE
MNEYQFTPQAANDFEIWCYIARDNIEAANRVEASILKACDLLAAAPLAGHIRNDLSDLPVRFWPVRIWSFTIRKASPPKSFGFFMEHGIFLSY